MAAIFIHILERLICLRHPKICFVISVKCWFSINENIEAGCSEQPCVCMLLYTIFKAKQCVSMLLSDSSAALWSLPALF